MKHLFLTITAAMLATVGFAQNKTTLVEYEDTQARMLNVESNAIFKPMVVEIEILEGVGENGKITDTFEFDNVRLESLNNDLTNVRSWATFQAAKKSRPTSLWPPLSMCATIRRSARVRSRS